MLSLDTLFFCTLTALTLTLLLNSCVWNSFFNYFSFICTVCTIFHNKYIAVKDERNGEGVPLYPAEYSGSGEHRKIPSEVWGRALGQSSSCKRFWGISCTILCDFTHLLVHLTYRLVGLMFPFNFLGCPNTHDIESVCPTVRIRTYLSEYLRYVSSSLATATDDVSVM